MTEQEIETFAHDLAQHMGKGWTAEPEYTRFTLLKDGVKRIHAYAVQYKGSHYSFSGYYPRDSKGRSEERTDDPKAGINLERGAKVVALEVKRRLWPDIEKLYSQRAAIVKANEQKYLDHYARVSELATSLGIEARKHWVKTDVFVTEEKIGNLSAEFEIGFYEGISLNMRNVPLDLAKHLALIISAEKKKYEACKRGV